MSRAWRFGVVALLLSHAVGCGNAPTGPKADATVAMKIRDSFGGSAIEVAVVKDEQWDGWATISGAFTYDGTAPARKDIGSSINKDQQVCAPGTMLSEQLIVNPKNGGIQNVVVYLTIEKGRNVPIHESALSPSGDAPVFDQIACVFTPHVLAVHMGRGNILFKNSDNVGHNTAMEPPNGKTISATIPANGSTLYPLQAEEPYPVGAACTIHPWMKGYLMVRSNGYFAVTDKDGKFTIPNLPAGNKLKIRVWHESAGRKKFIKCKADSAQGIKADSKGFAITLDGSKEATTDLTFELSASTFN